MTPGGWYMVSDRDPGFPWTKFEYLMRMPEIFEPQWEDGVDRDPAVAVGRQSFAGHRFVWMVMQDSKAWGFVAAGVRGQFWSDLHVGFRRECPGVVKKAAGLWTIGELFTRTPFRKVVGFVPEFNMPARMWARQMGMRPEGRITEACWRDGVPYDLIPFGVTKYEFSNWVRAFSQKYAHLPAEQPRSGPNGSEWDTGLGVYGRQPCTTDPSAIS